MSYSIGIANAWTQVTGTALGTNLVTPKLAPRSPYNGQNSSHIHESAVSTVVPWNWSTVYADVLLTGRVVVLAFSGPDARRNPTLYTHVVPHTVGVDFRNGS